MFISSQTPPSGGALACGPTMDLSEVAPYCREPDNGVRSPPFQSVGSHGAASDQRVTVDVGRRCGPPPRPRGGIGRRGRACRAGALSRRGDFQALLVTVLLTGMLSGAARATSAAERKTASIDSPSTFAAKSVSVVCGGNCARTAASTAA